MSGGRGGGGGGVTVKKVSEDAQTERGKGDPEKIPSETFHLPTFCGSLASLEKISGSKPFGRRRRRRRRGGRGGAVGGHTYTHYGSKEKWWEVPLLPTITTKPKFLASPLLDSQLRVTEESSQDGTHMHKKKQKIG